MTYKKFSFGEIKHEAIRSIAFLAVWFMVGDIFYKGIGVGQMETVAIKAVVHLVRTKAVTEAVMKGEKLMDLMATFVSNYGKRKKLPALHVKKKSMDHRDISAI